MGQTLGIQAMNMAIDKARQHGFGMITVRNSNHYGIAGYYAKMAVKEEMIGMCMTNTEGHHGADLWPSGHAGHQPHRLRYAR